MNRPQKFKFKSNDLKESVPVSKNKFGVLNNDSDDEHEQEKDQEKEKDNKFEQIQVIKTQDEKNKKKIYISENIDIGNTLYLHSPWSVFVHGTDCTDWTESSYTNIYMIDSIGSFWRFFNNFHMIDKTKNQIFIMMK